MIHEGLHRACNDGFQAAVAVQDAVVVSPHAFDQCQIVFHVTDQRPQADLARLVGQFHATVLAAYRADPAALGQPVRDFHQVWF